MKLIDIFIMISLGIGVMIGSYLLSKDTPKEIVTNNYKPSDFKENYKIDLKQDGYLIEDQDGEIYFVPNGQLEVWFLEMNL